MRKPQLGPFDWPPLPAATETARQAADRKARVRFQVKNAFGLLFGEAARHLGTPEAARLLLECAQAIDKRYKTKGRGRAKTRTGRSKQVEDEYLLMVAEDTGSPRRAAELVWRGHGSAFGNSIEAIEQRIKLLLQKRRQSRV
jgi:hypothetical protein